ncbi:MAG: PolC-type DNA polymerase III, partial [Ruminococcus sp.]|nr:PolC-type DNA polymerase III [Ruminococcus sp.]
MNINLAEFLKEYCSEIPESIRQGEIFKLTYSEKLDNINFFALFKNLVPSEDIFSFEKTVESAIRVDRIRLMCRYPSEIFGMNCYNELIKLLKRDIPVVNGFLDNADVKLNDNVLSITLKHGGRNILEKYHFCRSFSQLAYNQFGVEISVNLNGSENVSSDEYDRMMEKMVSELPDYSSQLKEEIPPEEAENTAPVLSQPVDISSLDTEFDKESAEIVTGKAIREKPVPISEAVQRLGEKLVVVGDVFASESKELRNEKTVVTFDITDYSGSLKVKIFAKNEEIESMNLSSVKKGTTLLVSGKIDFDNFAHDIV